MERMRRAVAAKTSLAYYGVNSKFRLHGGGVNP
jgi:hypothetical protein